jgi:hypothetical protein
VKAHTITDTPVRPAPGSVHPLSGCAADELLPDCDPINAPPREELCNSNVAEFTRDDEAQRTLFTHHERKNGLTNPAVMS